MKIAHFSNLFFAILLACVNCLFAQNAPTASELKQIELVMSPLRAKVEKALNDEDKAFYKAYLANIADLQKIKDSKTYKEELSKLETKYLPFIKKGYAKANIDENTYKAKIANILSKNIKFKFAPFLSIISENSGNTTPPPAPNGCKDLLCPFDIKNEKLTGTLITMNSAHANTCSISTTAFSDLAGAGDATAHTGKKIEIPAGKTKVRVTATEDFDMDGIAWAVLGGAYVESSIGLRAQGPSVNNTFTFKTDWAVAPVAWFASYEENATGTDIYMDFPPSNAGGNYTIQVFARSYSFAGAAFAGPVAHTNVNPITKIKVCWE